jgi:hypothetical protein
MATRPEKVMVLRMLKYIVEIEGRKEEGKERKESFAPFKFFLSPGGGRLVFSVELTCRSLFQRHFQPFHWIR